MSAPHAMLLAAALAVAAVPLLCARPVITEFMAQNNATLQDEDGDWSDWIEIHNPTAAPLPLADWHLTDRADNPTQWAFPEITLAPGGVTVATGFAPAYPPQQADVSFGLAMPGEWVRLSGKGAPVRHLVPGETSGPALGAAWRERAFDDSAWATGTLAVGFKVGSGDPLGMRGIFETNLQAQMYNLPNRLSVYLRIPFAVVDPAAILALETRTEYDDGYAAWLNTGGFAVDSANAPADPVWNSAATAVEFDENGLPPLHQPSTNGRP